jgi:hypothetical protein
MGISRWYAADLQFDGKVLTKISTGEIVEDYLTRLYSDCDPKEIDGFVLKRVEKVLTALEY